MMRLASNDYLLCFPVVLHDGVRRLIKLNIECAMPSHGAILTKHFEFPRSHESILG
jgi:hypothetical protein